MGMGTSTQQQQQQTKTDPWGPAVPYLQGLLGQIGAQFGNTGATGNENAAFDELMRNARGGNPYAGRIGGVADELLGGGPDRTGILNSGYSRLQSQLDPFASGSFVDPSQNPALQKYLDVARTDATGNINSMFAGAGRDMSGSHVKALGRGIGEAEAPILASAYENERGRQMGAIRDLFSGGQSTAAGLSALDQARFGNMQAGVGAADAALQARDSGANQLLNIERMRRQLPWQNIGALESMILPIAGLGGTSQGTSNTTRNDSIATQIAQLGQGLGGLGGFMWGRR